MEAAESLLTVFRELGEINFVQIIAILAAAWLLLLIDKRLLPLFARQMPGRMRMHLLALIPAIRLIVMIVAAVLVLRRIIEPTVENMVALFGFLGVGIGFAMKDYASSLIAGMTSLYENPYRPGDWITIDGTYGEVKSIEFRAVHLLTPDDTLVVVPHSKIWDTLIHNANNGSTKLQCVAHFYVRPDHDGARVRRRLRDVALTSPYVQFRHPIVVVAEDTPWGTHYRIRAYPIDPEQQFTFITDLSERGKAALLSMGVEFALAGAVAGPG